MSEGARMTSQAQEVDALSFPLHGSRLIEASAGTGKTFTIAALYLRLVLGHGGEQAFGRPLDPPEILVVTFTEAATLELRDRIRARLAEAAAFFRDGVLATAGDHAVVTDGPDVTDASDAVDLRDVADVAGGGNISTGHPVADASDVPEMPVARGDTYLRSLRDSLPPERWPDCAARLQLAAEWMDEAAVSTIHGWCSRMLREHAFDSGSLFTQKQVEDDAGLLLEACRDYWRSFVQQLDAAQAGVFLGWWKDFETFQSTICSSLEALLQLEGEAMAPLPAIESFLSTLDSLKAGWHDGSRADELQRLLLEARERKWVHGNLVRVESVHKRMGELRAWALDRTALMPGGKGAAGKAHLEWVEKWCTPQGIAQHWKQPPAEVPAACAALAGLLQGLRELPVNAGKAAVLRHAARWIDARHRQAREQRGELSPDDMLRYLDRALQAEGGKVLARRIRRQFPVALIDEFQDTDPVQYRIFDAIYQVDAPARRRGDEASDAGALHGSAAWCDAQAPEHGGMADGACGQEAERTALVLIGDPKQAIYAFRDADIHTYLRAREATIGRHYTLGTNYRSSSAMVDAVNHLFLAAEQRQGARGAFRFARDGHNPLPFLEVCAQGRSERWQDPAWPAGQTPALTIWQPSVDDPETSLGKGAHERRFAEATASEILRLLQAGQRGEALLGERGVQPADMAVLVSNGHQADLVRRALSRRGIASVYLSDRKSVFDGPVAEDLLRLLSACAEPGNGALLRAALGTALLALPLADLLRLQQDELHWEQQVARFQHYRQVWQQRGVLPMIRLLLQDFGVVARLLAAGEERLLTDVLHLAELLQQASGLLDGEQALIRHLREQRQQPAGDAKARQQRLESDEARVRVVTVHKSKGLEYPLVFLPFFCDVREVRKDALVLGWHDAQGQARHLLTTDENEAAIDEGRKAADEERLAEDLRKLYVALTRARHATWIGVDARTDLAASAAAYLLGWQADPGSAAGSGSEDGNLAGTVDAHGLKAAGKTGAPAAARSADAKGGRTRKSGEGKLSAEEKAARKRQEVIEKARAARRTLADAVQRLVESAGPGLMAVCPPPAADADGLWQPERGRLRWKASPPLPDRPASRWWIASYSALEIDQAARMEEAIAMPPIRQAETPREDDWREYLVDETLERSVLPQTTGSSSPELSMHGFPRGPRPGTFLHGLLEWAGGQGFAALAAQPASLSAEIARRLHHHPEWQPWQGVLSDWLMQLLDRPLLAKESGQIERLRLAGLRQYQVEMGFMVAVDGLDVQRLDAWVREHAFEGAPRPALRADTLNGMLKGFIDLVFEHEGRHYVLDYKSNWLGPGGADYRAASMQAAVLEHRYELQYLFYLLALHRLLKSRLPDYDYDRHVGGALYLFLRGIQSDSGGVFHARPSRAVIEALDAAFRGDERAMQVRREAA